MNMSLDHVWLSVKTTLTSHMHVRNNQKETKQFIDRKPVSAMPETTTSHHDSATEEKSHHRFELQALETDLWRGVTTKLPIEW